MLMKPIFSELPSTTAWVCCHLSLFIRCSKPDVFVDINQKTFCRVCTFEKQRMRLMNVVLNENRKYSFRTFGERQFKVHLLQKNGSLTDRFFKHGGIIITMGDITSLSRYHRINYPLYYISIKRLTISHWDKTRELMQINCLNTILFICG